MKNGFGLALAIAVFASVPSFAQREEVQHAEPQHAQPQHAEAPHVNKDTPRANGGHVPPAPPSRTNPAAGRESQKFEDGRTSDRPHVSNDHWYGHEAPNDARFHLDKPYAQGRFERFGPSYRYKVLRVDLGAHRFWFPGGFYFEVAAWDWTQCSDWCWQCGDDFVIYDDTDHPGWYLLYNVHTGVYVHVQYLGH